MVNNWKPVVDEKWTDQLNANTQLKQALLKTQNAWRRHRLYPYLVIGSKSISSGNIEKHIDSSENGYIKFFVRNEGRFSSFNCFARVYCYFPTKNQIANNSIGSVTLKECVLVSQDVFPLQAAEERLVKLPGGIYPVTIVVCFDPMYDPIDFPNIGTENRHKAWKYLQGPEFIIPHPQPDLSKYKNWGRAIGGHWYA